MNIAYFGESSYWVESAAYRFFSKRAKDLIPVEAATLASLVQRHGEFDPFSKPEKAEARRNVVLKNMANLGYITQTEAAKYQDMPLVSTLKRGTVFNGCADSTSPFFCEYVLNTLLNDPAMGDTPEDRENFIKQGGLTIATTLQSSSQSAAQKAVDEAIPRDDESMKAAAISMVVPQTGHVVAPQSRLLQLSGSRHHAGSPHQLPSVQHFANCSARLWQSSTHQIGRAHV